MRMPYPTHSGRTAVLASIAIASALAAVHAAPANPPAPQAGQPAQAARPATAVASPATNAAPAAASPAVPASSAAPAENVVYKWKDAHGVSQYSQQPPPKGVKYETVQMTGTVNNGLVPQSTGGKF